MPCQWGDAWRGRAYGVGDAVTSVHFGGFHLCCCLESSLLHFRIGECHTRRVPSRSEPAYRAAVGQHSQSHHACCVPHKRCCARFRSTTSPSMASRPSPCAYRLTQLCKALQRPRSFHAAALAASGPPRGAARCCARGCARPQQGLQERLMPALQRGLIRSASWHPARQRPFPRRPHSRRARGGSPRELRGRALPPLQPPPQHSKPPS